MYLSNLNYTIGNYSESPEGIISTSGSALLAQTLAWAAQNDIPFQDVILSLTKRGNPGSGFKRALFLFPRSKKWDMCLLASYSDLLNGVPLYKTLRKRLSYFLPEYYLQAVEKAEKEGHLRETLSPFAKRLSLSFEAKKYYKRSIFLAVIEFTVLFCILLFLTIFIFPNFGKIFSELTCQNPPDSWSSFILSGMVNAVEDFFLGILFILILIHFFGRMFVRVRRFVLMLLGEVFIFIPPFKKQLRSVALLDLSSSMASYLDVGEDILNAARFSEKACNYFWLKRKLKRFICKLENGENWLDAWNCMNLKQNFSEVIIRNAAAKENIVGGFDTISDWLYHKQVRTIKNNAVCFFVGGVALNAVIVFCIMFYVFQMLTQIIYAWT